MGQPDLEQRKTSNQLRQIGSRSRHLEKSPFTNHLRNRLKPTAPPTDFSDTTVKGNKKSSTLAGRKRPLVPVTTRANKCARLSSEHKSSTERTSSVKKLVDASKRGTTTKSANSREVYIDRRHVDTCAGTAKGKPIASRKSNRSTIVKSEAPPVVGSVPTGSLKQDGASQETSLQKTCRNLQGDRNDRSFNVTVTSSRRTGPQRENVTVTPSKSTRLTPSKSTRLTPSKSTRPQRENFTVTPYRKTRSQRENVIVFPARRTMPQGNNVTVTPTHHESSQSSNESDESDNAALSAKRQTRQSTGVVSDLGGLTSQIRHSRQSLTPSQQSSRCDSSKQGQASRDLANKNTGDGNLSRRYMSLERLVLSKYPKVVLRKLDLSKGSSTHHVSRRKNAKGGSSTKAVPRSIRTLPTHGTMHHDSSSRTGKPVRKPKSDSEYECSESDSESSEVDSDDGFEAEDSDVSDNDHVSQSSSAKKLKLKRNSKEEEHGCLRNQAQWKVEQLMNIKAVAEKNAQLEAKIRTLKKLKLKRKSKEEEHERLRNQAQWKVEQLMNIKAVAEKNALLEAKIRTLQASNGNGSSTSSIRTPHGKVQGELRKLKAEVQKASPDALLKKIAQLDKDIEGLNPVLNSNMLLEAELRQLVHPGVNLTNQQLEQKRKEGQDEQQRLAPQQLAKVKQLEEERQKKAVEREGVRSKVIADANEVVDKLMHNLSVIMQNGGIWPSDLKTAMLPVDQVEPEMTITTSKLASSMTPVESDPKTPVKAKKPVSKEVVSSDTGSETSLDDVSASSSSSEEEKAKTRSKHKGKTQSKRKATSANDGRTRRGKKDTTASDDSDIDFAYSSDNEAVTSRRTKKRTTRSADIKKNKIQRKTKRTLAKSESSDSLESEIEFNFEKQKLESLVESDSDSDVAEDANAKSKGWKISKKNTRKRKIGKSQSSEADNKKGQRQTRSRGKSSTNGDNSASDDSDEDTSKSPHQRKRIRKLMKARKLDAATKEAARLEKERLQRVEQIKSQHKVVQVEDPTSPTRCPLTTQLVLEFDSKGRPLVEVSQGLVKKLKPHQVEAVQFLWDSCIETVGSIKKQKGSGCILAHCMGLGKTLSVIAFVHTLLTHMCTHMKTCLVVCPLNTVLNWEKEWTKWLTKKDQLNVYQLTDTKANKERSDMLLKWHSTGGVMIMGYQMFRILSTCKVRSEKMRTAFQTTLIDSGPDLVVCDEGHVLKNDETVISKCMNKIRTARRIVLTGTPLQNNLIEYHCMVQFVKPNLLGTRKEFSNRFVNPIINGQCSDSTPSDVKLMKRRAHVLHEMLAGCVQRRDYSVITRYLPAKYEYVLSVRLSSVQKELYAKYLQLVGKNLVLLKKGALTGGKLFTDYHNLLHIWTHPWVLELDRVRQEEKALRNQDSDESDIDLLASSSEDESSVDQSADEVESSERTDNKEVGNKLSRSSSEDRSNKSGNMEEDEVIKRWTTRRMSKTEAIKKLEPCEKEAVPSTAKWWEDYVSSADDHKMELGGKLVLLFDILRLAAENQDKVLVFSHSLLSLDLIEQFLAHSAEQSTQDVKNTKKGKQKSEGVKADQSVTWIKNSDYFRLDGSTLAYIRKRWVSTFQDPKNKRARLFLISTKAGGLGINLEAANRVVIFDASWNPSHDIQSIFRVYRFGQVKPCFIYRFLAQGTMEEKIYERQVMKQTLSKRVVDEQQIQRHFTASDLSELYQFRPASWDPDAPREVPRLPKDVLLAHLLQQRPEWIVKYHEHNSLLENQEEEVLTEEERKAAWEEFEREKDWEKQQDGVARKTVVSRFDSMLRLQIPNLTRVILNEFPDSSSEEVMTRLRNFIDSQMKSQARAVVQQEANIKKQLEAQHQRELQYHKQMARSNQVIGYVQPTTAVRPQGYVSQITAPTAQMVSHPRLINPQYFRPHLTHAGVRPILPKSDVTNSQLTPRSESVVLSAPRTLLPGPGMSSQILQSVRHLLPAGATSNIRIVRVTSAGAVNQQPVTLLLQNAGAGQATTVTSSSTTAASSVPVRHAPPLVATAVHNIPVARVQPSFASN